MNIKDFNCCGSNEWLISRSEARQLVRGFRQDLREGVVDWTTTFGFCISCGSEYTYFDACHEKGEEYAIAFYNQQLNRTNGLKFAHKIKQFGGFSSRYLLNAVHYTDSKGMERLYNKNIEALTKMKKVDLK
tara:strand:+ start:707 stop:1099 length:393 start_codon:yes stop_codon:yes gene_type:complete